MLGGTIHDVAQVVGAGYAVSETVGNTAVDRQAVPRLSAVPGRARDRLDVRAALGCERRRPHPVPGLCAGVRGAVRHQQHRDLDRQLAPAFALIKAPLIEASTWGLLIAISALGSARHCPRSRQLGWRHVATVTGTTVVILVVVTAGLMILN